MNILSVFRFRSGLFLAMGMALLAGANDLRAATTGSDNGTNYTANGWVNGSNGGTGFGNWAFANNNNNGGSYAGEFLGNSQYTGGAVYGGGNRIGIGTSAWGMYSDTGSEANAVRPLTGGGLSVGQTIRLDMSTGYSNNGSVRGFQLLTSSDVTGVSNGGEPSAVRFQYTFTGGENSYRVNNETGGTVITTTGITNGATTAHGFTDQGMSTSFTLTSTDTFTFSVTFNDNSTTETFTGSLGGTLGSTIDGVRLYDYNAGGGSQNDLFFNNLAVSGAAVPEPATVCGGLLVTSLLALRLRSRSRSGRAPGTV